MERSRGFRVSSPQVSPQQYSVRTVSYTHLDVYKRQCQVPVGGIGAKAITTVEGLAQNGALHPVQKAWLDLDVPQCGYCQSGMMMAAVALLKDKPKPTDADIDATITNICRCGTYQRVRAAIHAAANSA